MSSRVRRCIDLGPQAIMIPGYAGGTWSYTDYRFVHPTAGATSQLFTDSGTTWVRLWAPWDVLQPDKNHVPGEQVSDPGPDPDLKTTGGKLIRAYRALQTLDNSIQAARATNRRIMLCAWRTPPWAAGLETIAQGRDLGTDIAAEVEYMHADRMQKGTYQTWQATNNADLASRKRLEYVFPTYLDSTSPWAKFIRFLYDRYRPSNGVPDRTIDVLEICNEPNLQMWPQQGASNSSDPFGEGDIAAHCAVAQMIQTAITIGAAFGHELHLAGPGTWDGVEPDESYVPRMRTYSNQLWQGVERGFTSLVLGALDAANTRAPSRFIWTHHNYGDMDNKRTDASTNVVHKTRVLLQGAWTGYTEGNGPIVFVTEGGAHLSVIDDRLNRSGSATYLDVLDEQGRVVAANGAAMNSADGSGSVGDGVGLLTACTLYGEDSGQDVGLRQWADMQHVSKGGPAPGAARPAYNSWKNINQARSDLSDWARWEDLGAGSVSEPTIASWAPGRLDLFYNRTTDPQLWHSWLSGGTWYGPEALGGSINAKPAAVSWGSGRLDIAVRRSDNSCGLVVYEGQWFPVQDLGGVLAYGPAISSRGPGMLDVWCIGTDGALYQKAWYPGWQPSQTGWWRQGGGPFTSAPSVVSWSSNRIDVFVRGADSTLQHLYWISSSGWSGWESLGGSLASAPAACAWRSGRLDVFARSTAGNLTRRIYDQGKWMDWEPVPVPDASGVPNPGVGAVSAVCWAPGRIDLACSRPGNTNLWHTAYR